MDTSGTGEQFTQTLENSVRVTDLSVYFEGIVLELDASNTGHLPGLLYVGSVSPDSQAHQVRGHAKLLHVSAQ